MNDLTDKQISSLRVIELLKCQKKLVGNEIKGL